MISRRDVDRPDVDRPDVDKTRTQGRHSGPDVAMGKIWKACSGHKVNKSGKLAGHSVDKFSLHLLG